MTMSHTWNRKENIEPSNELFPGAPVVYEHNPNHHPYNIVPNPSHGHELGSMIGLPPLPPVSYELS